MAHRVDDLNYTTVSGQRRFKDSPIPGTTFSANMANMFQEELVRTVEAAGLTPAASAAADQAAGWSQLLAAVKILANIQLQDTATFPHTSITSGSTLTPPINGVALGTFIRLGGSYGPGNITLAESDGNYANKLIFVENDGTEINHIGSTNHRVRIEPGKMAIFKYDANRASGSKWVPVMVPNNTDSVPEGNGNLYYTLARVQDALANDSTCIDTILAWVGNWNSSHFNEYFDPEFAAAFSSAFGSAFPSSFASALAASDTDDLAESATKKYVNKLTGSFTMHMYEGWTDTSVDSGTATWEIIDDHVFLTIPLLNGSVPDVALMRLTAASDAAFPTDIRVTAERNGVAWGLKDLETVYLPVRVRLDETTHKITLSGWLPESYAEIRSFTFVYRK